MKSTGRLITFVIIIIFIHGTVTAAEIKSDLTRNRIESGSYTTLKVKISGTTADIRPVKVPAVKGLDIKLSGTSRSVEIVNSRTWIGFILNFSIYAEKKGVYRIPPFIIEADGERLSTGEYQLTVTEGRGGGELPGKMTGEVDLTVSEVYAGEPLLMRYFIKGTGDDIRIERLNEPVQSKGFVMKALKEEGREQGQMDADNRMYIASYCLIAADSGKHEIGGGAISILYEVSRGFMSRVLRREIRFPGKTVNIKPLPAAGRPALFKGDVGEFSLEAGEPSGSFRAGEEMRIPVKVSGRGNLIMMSPVSVEKEEGIKLLVEDSDPKLSVDNRTLTGEKEYTVTVIPEKEGQCNIGRIFLLYFNPYKGVYERAESGPVSFSVSPPQVEREKEIENAPGSESISLPKIAVAAAVVLIVICGIVLYLQTGRYRIVKAETLHEKRDEPEPAPVDREKLLRGEFESAYNDKNSSLFRLKAEKLAVLISDNLRDNEKSMELDNIRERINLFRYGGAVPTEEDIREIYMKIRKLS